MKNCFLPADILLPKTDDLTKWSVVACDQYTSQPEYWQRVRQRVGQAPSALNLILPEAELGAPDETQRIAAINANMDQALKSGLFELLPDSYIYVERTLDRGRVRRGLVGRVDLEAYDYSPDSTSPIRATEGTVASRLPPRIRVRQDAALELPHILLLCDDPSDELLGPVAQAKGELRSVYDFELMEDGGHIAGWQVRGEQAAAFDRRLVEFAARVADKYPDLPGTPMVFAMGDGNHSLATAKACWEALKEKDPSVIGTEHPARYALVELENIHDPALEFEPIHRVVSGTDPQALLAALREAACAETGYSVAWFAGSETGTVYLDPAKSELAVGVLQGFLDRYLQDHPGEVDYIHGDDVLRELSAAPNAIGFLLPPMEKSQLFRGVIADGVLPRKTFSMGQANEKRFYLEARAIR